MSKLIAVLTALFLLSIPAVAVAGEPIDPNLGDTVLGKSGGIRYASDPAAYDAGSSHASVEVGCGGPAWHLLGGGSAGGGPADAAWSSASRWYDFDDADDRGDDGWFANGYGSTGSEMTGYSICMRDGSLRYPTEDIPDDSSSDRHGTVSCGGGKWHVTSGSAFIATSNSWVTSSWPTDGEDPNTAPDDRWSGSVHDTIGGIGGFGIYAVCASGLDLHYRRSGPSPLQAGETIGRRAACGQDAHVVGGGARVTGPTDEARLVASFPQDGPDDDTVPDDRWRVRVHGVSGDEKAVKVFAICLR